MNILILNGSPRKEGNTSTLLKAFVKGAESAGHNVKTVQVGTKKINGCMACEYCHTKGEGQCVQKDDMQEIYEAIKTTDLMVLASPVYYWSWSGQLQSAISRFYTTSTVDVKKFAMILSSNSPDVYDAPISQYHSMMKYFGSEDVGIFTYCGEANQAEESMAELEKFGASL